MNCLLLFLAVLPVDGPHEIRVDRIERNTVIGDYGELIVDQHIFWNLYPDGWHVMDWRPAARSEMVPDRGQYVVYLRNSHTPVRIVSDWYHVTLTSRDPERDDQQLLEYRHRETIAKILEDRHWFNSVFAKNESVLIETPANQNLLQVFHVRTAQSHTDQSDY